MEPDPHYSDSPFLALLETALEEWGEGHASVGLLLRPHHLNRSGVVHGGVLATLLDHAGGLSGLHCSVPGRKRYGMTLSLTTSYLRQSRAGKLTAVGRRVSGGSKIYFATSEVRTDTGDLLATASGVYRYRSGSESGRRREPPAIRGGGGSRQEGLMSRWRLRPGRGCAARGPGADGPASSRPAPRRPSPRSPRRSGPRAGHGRPRRGLA